MKRYLFLIVLSVSAAQGAVYVNTFDSPFWQRALRFEHRLDHNSCRTRAVAADGIVQDRVFAGKQSMVALRRHGYFLSRSHSGQHVVGDRNRRDVYPSIDTVVRFAWQHDW